MNNKNKVLSAVVGSLALIGTAVAVLLPVKATKDNAVSTSLTFRDSLKSTLHKRSFPNKTAQGKEDSIVDANFANMQNGFNGKGIYDTVAVPPVVTPPNTGTNPGGPALVSTTYNNQSNINLTSRTVTGGTLVFNNCKNVVINLCTFNGGKGTNLYAVTFNNCTNVTCTNNFGVLYCNFFRVKGGSGINISNNQLLNLYEPTIYAGDFAHAIRFESVTGAGNQIVNNSIENVQGQCVNPHDIINLVNCVGTSASHILVKGNKIRGGMVKDYFGLGTGAGITLDNGTYIDVICNIGVNPGCALFQANAYNGGTHNTVLLDGNIGVSLIASSVAADGIVALGSKTNVTFSNNRINWINKNGKTGTNFAGGEVLYWFGGSASPAGIKLINNTFDKSLTADVLPKVIITYHL